MTLLTRELRKRLFFDPVGLWTWYVLEGSPVDTRGEVCAEQDAVDFLFFGFIVRFEAELGYFTERELETAKDGLRRAGGAD